MKHRIGMAVVCLHISAVLYLLAAVVIVVLWTKFARVAEIASEPDDPMMGLHGLICLVGVPFILGLIALIELVAHGLNQRKFWAWIVGLCIFATFLPSLFLPLGAFGLWGLLDEGSRAEFGVGGGRAASEQMTTDRC